MTFSFVMKDENNNKRESKEKRQFLAVVGGFDGYLK